MTQQITDQYMMDIIQILKNVAFHEIFMQKLRQQLADNEQFDPFTAFKTIDSFKHNMIINVQLKGFLEMQGYEVTNLQAQQAIQCLNKSEDSLNYDRFLQMVMPYDIKKRNLCISRYNKMEVGIGTYDLVSRIKHTSKQQIAKFFIKEIQFSRNFKSERQYFCQKWGGDIYTIGQSLFKVKHDSLNTSLRNPLFDYQSKNNFSEPQSFKNKDIDFNIFYDFGRKFSCYFNKTEFKSIWRRIKSVQQKIVLKPEQIFLSQHDLTNFLLVKDFNTKLKYANQYSIPLKNLQMPPPSYKQPIPQQKIHNSYQHKQQRQKQYFERKISEVQRQIHDPLSNCRLKSYFSYPELQHNCVSVKLKEKQEEWKNIVKTMNPAMVDEMYWQIMQSNRGGRWK